MIIGTIVTPRSAEDMEEYYEQRAEEQRERRLEEEAEARGKSS